MKQLFLLFLMALLPMAVSADDSGICGDPGDNVTWSYVESTHTLTISGNGKMMMYAYGEYRDPWYGETPWDKYKDKIQKIVIQSGVTSVSGFYSCKNLTSVSLSNTVKEIQSFAFSGCPITSITFPNSVESIGTAAFMGCGLTSVTIPCNVNWIDHSFTYCSSLNTIKVDPGNSFFDSRNDCNAIIQSENDMLILGCKNTVIPEGILDIYEYAFAGCTGLSSLKIPQSVIAVGAGTFKGCDNLSAVYCYAAVVPFISNTSIWNPSLGSVQNAILYVPSTLLDEYNNPHDGNGLLWKEFKSIMSIDSAGDPKCSTPTITIENGIMNLDCATEGVDFHYTISIEGNWGGKDIYNKANDIEGKGILLPIATISVYTSKEGYSMSDTATKIVKFSDVGGLKGDLNGDGEVNVADHVELTKIIMDQRPDGSE